MLSVGATALAGHAPTERSSAQGPCSPPRAMHAPRGLVVVAWAARSPEGSGAQAHIAAPPHPAHAAHALSDGQSSAGLGRSLHRTHRGSLRPTTADMHALGPAAPSVRCSPREPMLMSVSGRAPPPPPAASTHLLPLGARPLWPGLDVRPTSTTGPGVRMAAELCACHPPHALPRAHPELLVGICRTTTNGYKAT